MKGNEEIINTNNNNFIYRKDSFYKHFKSIFVKYLKDKINRLKNICFPNFDKNNFSSLFYKYTENPKEKDNYIFLSFKVKDLFTYEKNDKNKNRQYILLHFEQNFYFLRYI